MSNPSAAAGCGEMVSNDFTRMYAELISIDPDIHHREYPLLRNPVMTRRCRLNLSLRQANWTSGTNSLDGPSLQASR
jgi:hypothetical protein